jgi:5-formyltetrahydrofolate cyclo-ligase
MDLRAAKAQLRADMKARRAGLAAADLSTFAAQASANLRATPEWRAAKVVCLYVAFKQELGTNPLLQAVLDEGKVLALPRTHPDGRLSLHEVSDLTTLLASRLGILEPPTSAPERRPVDIDLFLVPGLAFDSEGHRLGHGAGFYDRLLAQTKPSTATIGYGYDFQLLARVPTEPHDVALQAVVTPQGIHRRRTH